MQFANHSCMWCRQLRLLRKSNQGHYWRSLQSSSQFRLVFPYCVFSSCLRWNLLLETVSRIRNSVVFGAGDSGKFNLEIWLALLVGWYKYANFARHFHSYWGLHEHRNVKKDYTIDRAAASRWVSHVPRGNAVDIIDQRYGLDKVRILMPSF